MKRKRQAEQGALKINGLTRAHRVYPFGNQAPVCLALSILACVLGTLAHPAPTTGTDPDPVTFWNSRETLGEGLGKAWYSSVVLWAGLSLVLTLAAMVIFSQFVFPGTGP